MTLIILNARSVQSLFNAFEPFEATEFDDLQSYLKMIDQTISKTILKNLCKE